MHDRPLSVPEIVGKIEAVDEDAVQRLAARLLASRPSFAALGPIAQVEDFDRLTRRLGGAATSTVEPAVP